MPIDELPSLNEVQIQRQKKVNTNQLIAAKNLIAKDTDNGNKRNTIVVLRNFYQNSGTPS